MTNECYEKQNKKSKTMNKYKKCLCETLRPAITICRMVGFFPVITKHQNGQCIFYSSPFWMIHTFMLLLGLILGLICSTSILNIMTVGKNKSTIRLLSELNSIIYCAYVILLLILNEIKHSQIAKLFNFTQSLAEKIPVCQSSKRTTLLIHLVYIFFFIVYVAGYILSIALMYTSENANYGIVFNNVIQIATFIIYLNFSIGGIHMISISACFEKLLMSCLDCKYVHPLYESAQKDMNDFAGLVTYNACNEEHDATMLKTKYDKVKLIEYLRRIHEDILKLVDMSNSLRHPQMFIHLAVELGVLIIHYYSIVLYYFKDFGEEDRNVHINNCLFALSHSCGLLVFLRKCSALHDKVTLRDETFWKYLFKRYFQLYFPIHHLLEYSSRETDANVQLQIRLFIEEIQNNKSLTASDIFTVDLGIAAPVSNKYITKTNVFPFSSLGVYHLYVIIKYPSFDTLLSYT